MTIAQTAQQAFPRVSDRLEARQTKKAAAAFDGVDATKDAGDDLGRARILLEREQTLLDGVQALVTFDRKFLDDIVHGMSAGDPACATYRKRRGSIEKCSAGRSGRWCQQGPESKGGRAAEVAYRVFQVSFSINCHPGRPIADRVRRCVA